jgi:Na+:H+ antiporter, NhaC family
MLSTVRLIIAALAFGAVVERAALRGRLVDPIVRHLRITGALIVTVVVICIITNVVAGDQYVAVVVPGPLFKSNDDAKLTALQLDVASD